jgi:NTP pyrophosphatase (non-canonical NTP hydrolase)
MNNLTFNEYQDKVNKTYYFVGDTFREELLYLALAVNSEAGEMGDEIKKAMRDNGGNITDERLDNIKKEMGDVLFYMGILCTKLGINFSDAANAELIKLDKKIKEYEQRTGKKFDPLTFKK